MAFVRWWEAWPGRLEHELEAFGRRGWKFSLDEAEWKAGRVLLRGMAPIGPDETAELVVVYPDTFPHTRVSIYAPSLQLDRHQNPLETNLCTLPRSSVFWRPSMLAAQVVETQVPEVIRLAREGDPSRFEAEYQQGEPASAYFPYMPAGGILIPPEAFVLSEDIKAGTMRVRFDPDDAWLTEPIGNPASEPLLGVGALVALSDGTADLLVDDEIVRSFIGAEWNGRWVHLPAAPITLDLGSLMRLLVAEDPRFGQRRWIPHGRHSFELIGVAFPEEVRQKVWETGWLFLVLHKESKDIYGGRFVRAMRYSEDHLAERVTELVPLRSKTVGLVGAGALGAPICFQLAMSLVRELRPLDYDFIDPATSVRWPAGVRAAGSDKTLYLKEEIEAQYPLTRVVPFSHMIGAAPMASRQTEAVTLESWLADVDLVIDASAEDNVSRALAHLTHPAGIPQIYVWSIEGFSGVVARVRPGRTGCYLCLERALSEGRIAPPTAPERERRVQPRGCSDPTFVAPNIDLGPLSLEASRLAISQLCAGTNGYPSVDYDVLVFRIRDSNGDVRVPTWEPSVLESYDDCALCDVAA